MAGAKPTTVTKTLAKAVTAVAKVANSTKAKTTSKTLQKAVSAVQKLADVKKQTATMKPKPKPAPAPAPAPAPTPGFFARLWLSCRLTSDTGFCRCSNTPTAHA